MNQFYTVEDLNPHIGLNFPIEVVDSYSGSIF